MKHFSIEDIDNFHNKFRNNLINSCSEYKSV